jgi:hypothetical protein
MIIAHHRRGEEVEERHAGERREEEPPPPGPDEIDDDRHGQDTHEVSRAGVGQGAAEGPQVDAPEHPIKKEEGEKAPDGQPASLRSAHAAPFILTNSFASKT